MTAITVEDLDNAKLDVDHIAEIATSLEPTATDRMGHVKLTMTGAIDRLLGVNPRGAWVTGTAYAVKDVFSNAGITYIAVLAHTSTTISADLAAGKIALYQGVMVQTTDQFTAGVDFTGGVTTQLTLSRAPGTKDNLLIHFDSSYQGPDQWSLSGNVVTFNGAIPVGVVKVFAQIGIAMFGGTVQDGSVGTSGLVDGAVTNPKLAANAVKDPNVAADAGINSSKLNFFSATGVPARSVENRLRDVINVKDFGAVGDGITDDSGAIQTAISKLDNAGRGLLYFPAGIYRTTSQLGIVNKRVRVVGDGAQVSTIRCEMTSGIAMYISQDDYTYYTTVEGLTFTTNQLSQVDGLVIQYGEADATNNRIQDRVTIRDLQFYGSVFNLVGFKRGIALINVHAAYVENVNIAGQGYAVGMNAGVDLVSTGTAAPADIVFRNVKVYYGLVGFRGAGHLEGLNFSQCFAIACAVGWDFRLSSAYPWFTMSQCHANVTSQGIHLENFSQSFITDNLIYIVNQALASTPVGISLTACDDSIVGANNIVNPTFVSGTTVVGIFNENSLRVKIADNKVAGYNVGYWLAGSADYTRTFDNEASTPYAGAVAYNMAASGANNTVRSTP